MACQGECWAASALASAAGACWWHCSGRCNLQSGQATAPTYPASLPFPRALQMLALLEVVVLEQEALRPDDELPCCGGAHSSGDVERENLCSNCPAVAVPAVQPRQEKRPPPSQLQQHGLCRQLSGSARHMPPLSKLRRPILRGDACSTSSLESTEEE